MISMYGLLRGQCISLQKWSFLPFSFTPWVDGHYLTDHPAQLVREGRHAKVEIISGVTKDEGALLTLRNYIVVIAL